MPLRQWMLRITAFADELAADLDGLDWPEGTVAMQRAWIGRSEGAEICFPLHAAADEARPVDELRVFTTRPDTLLGVTYVVVAPEHPLPVALSQGSGPTARAVCEYLEEAASKTDLERASEKAKTGVFTGAYVTHPLTGEVLPVWVADYVVATYGTGAVMAVPAHDERDFGLRAATRTRGWALRGAARRGRPNIPHDRGLHALAGFAKRQGLPFRRVVQAEGAAESDAAAAEDMEAAFVEPGVCVASGAFDGLRTAECKRAVVQARLASRVNNSHAS